MATTTPTLTTSAEIIADAEFEYVKLYRPIGDERLVMYDRYANMLRNLPEWKEKLTEADRWVLLRRLGWALDLGK